MSTEWTLADFKTLFRASANEPTAGLFSDAMVVEWFNMAEYDIASKTGCIETISALTTTAYSRLVSFTGNKVNAVELVLAGSNTVLVSGEVQFRDTNDVVWHDTSEVVWRDVGTEVDVPYAPHGVMQITPHHLGHISKRESADPQYWFQWGNYIVIEPVPQDTYNLNVYTSILPTAQMAADVDKSSLPTEFQSAIVPYAVTMAFLRKRKYQRAAIKYAEYISLLQSLINNHIKRRSARMFDIRLPDSTEVK